MTEPVAVTTATFGTTTVATSNAVLTYQGTPAANNLVESQAGTAFTDPYGNQVLPGTVSYATDRALQVLPDAVTPYTNATSGAQSGAWNPGTPIAGTGAASGAEAGTVALVAGTATVTGQTLPANAVVVVSYDSVGTQAGVLSVSAVTGAGFTVTSSNPADTSTVAWIAASGPAPASA